MTPLQRRDLIIEAVKANDIARLDAFIALCIDAENARAILNKRGYGLDCTSFSATAARVPARTK